MLAKIHSAAIRGVDALLVEVEADLGAGLPSFTIVGLPDKAIEESRERIRAAVKNAHANFPTRRITVNLAPANGKKIGPAYDLPIAISILVADQQISPKKIANSLIVGELALDGKIRPVSGLLAIAQFAKRQEITKIFLPQENAPEASLIEGLEIYPLSSLSDFLSYLKDEISFTPFTQSPSLANDRPTFTLDFNEIKGQNHAKRALEIAASGGHNVLLSGPPGSGKTLLAKAFAGILPRMSREEIIEVTTIYSIAGELTSSSPVISKRPFRSPHHTSSKISIVGGGSNPRPGEITLAHRGVLFLDELPEFPRSVLETLRQPLEEGEVAISRASSSVRYPARFTLISAMNPCPCGYLTDPDKPCQCHPSQIINYRKKISGPLLDRIDLHLEVPRLNYEKLTAKTKSESSSEIQKRVENTRDIQLARFQNTHIKLNSQMGPKQIEKYCTFSADSEEIIKKAVDQLQPSGRAYHRILKIARTIADLQNTDQILKEHLIEALQYRPRETNLF